MVWQYNVYALPLFFAALMSLGLTPFMWRRRRFPGAIAFVGLLLLIAEWSLTDGLEYMSADLPSILFWDKAIYVGSVAVPVAYLIFVLYYTGRNRLLSTRNISLLSIIPAATLLLRWTDETHHLFYGTYGLVTSYGLTVLQCTYGYWFYVDVAYSYALVLFAIALLVRQFSRSQGVARRQSLILLVSTFVPLAASIVDVLNFNTPFDWTPLAFTFTGFGFFWAVFRLHLFELMPVAREAIVRDMPDAVIVLDPSGRVVDINPAGEQIFGSGAGIIGKSVREIFENHGLNKQYLAKETSEISLTVNGVQRYFNLTFSDLQDKWGGLVGRIGVLRDVTDLATSERKYHLLLDNMADSVFTIDLEGNLTFASPQTVGMSGYSNEQLLSMNIRRLIAPEDLPAVMKRLAARGRGEKGLVPVLFHLIRSDGTRLPVEAHTRLLVKGGRPVGVQGVARDITERVKMEDALRESEDRLRAIFESVNAGIMIIDPRKHVIVDANPLALKMVGATRDRVVGSKCHKFICTAEEGRCPITDLGQDVDNAERVLLRVDGKTTSILKSVTTVLNGEEYLLESFIDISERNHMEEELLKSKRLAAVGEAAAMVGHDLRNPLQTTTTTLYLAKKLLSSGGDEGKNEALGLLKDLDDQVYYMDKIVSDLQDYARQVGAELFQVNLPDQIREAVSNVKIPRTVHLSYLIEGTPLKAIVNPTLLRRVLVNLILNATQAMPNGGELTVTANTVQDSAVITVQDTGIGIPAENLEKLFTPFFTTKAQGQGLGLAVCKRLVEAQGGEITVKSEVGKGSTFTLKLRLSGSVGAN
jgi:PAS domain S-box-containing protein